MKRADFEASRAGLRQILERRGKEFAVVELIQNAFDEAGVTTVSVMLEPLANRPAAHLRVEDDSPTGFRDLSHGYTLFADSYKRKNAELRGRFNLGEKLVDITMGKNACRVRLYRAAVTALRYASRRLQHWAPIK